MSPSKQLFLDLSALAEPANWTGGLLAPCRKAEAGEYQFLLEQKPGAQLWVWRVEHGRYGLLGMGQEPSAPMARTRALDYASAHAQGQYEPQHLDQ